MSIQACADLVARGDPARFRAAMAAPVEARRVLFPIYAFGLEIARAPFVTQEAMIAEMRLQWWRDALDEIATQGAVRRHEVVTPLAEVIDAQGAGDLIRAIEARRWDIYRDPFADEAALVTYLEQTSAPLTWTAARILGAEDAMELGVTQMARAAALARYFQAVPALEALGRRPLVDGRPDAVRALAETGLEWWREGRKTRLPTKVRSALLDTATAPALLRKAVRNSVEVADGTLTLNPFQESLLLWRSRLLGP